MTGVSKPSYGRCLEDFQPGDVYAHPWDVTVDAGMLGMFAASFQDATPLYASRRYAEAFGFRDRPLHPLLLLNLGLSFSVHDVSEQAFAHLAYIDVRFPEAAYPGDTLTASSRVLSVKPVSTGDRGVIGVRTVVENQHGQVVCRFDRKALVRAGKVAGRPENPWPAATQPDTEACAYLPKELRGGFALPERRAGFPGFFEDFDTGDVIFHKVGKTVGESEHMLLTQLFRNSHAVHFDEVYSKHNSFANTRVVYGGLVLAWILTLTSRDLTGNALWDVGLDDGAHPNGVTSGDTLYAATKVVQKEDTGPNAGVLTLRVVGTKNRTCEELFVSPGGLFTAELSKQDGGIAEKVVEITRRVLVRKRPAN
jgi:2-methylfumaryl-CoA hydratase